MLRAMLLPNTCRSLILYSAHSIAFRIRFCLNMSFLNITVDCDGSDDPKGCHKCQQRCGGFMCVMCDKCKYCRWCPTKHAPDIPWDVFKRPVNACDLCSGSKHHNIGCKCCGY